MIVISEGAFKALSDDARARGVEVCQRCPIKEVGKGIRTLYLGPNGEREIIFRNK
jgi:hypothetical protein